MLRHLCENPFTLPTVHEGGHFKNLLTAEAKSRRQGKFLACWRALQSNAHHFRALTIPHLTSAQHSRLISPGMHSSLRFVTFIFVPVASPTKQNHCVKTVYWSLKQEGFITTFMKWWEYVRFTLSSHKFSVRRVKCSVRAACYNLTQVAISRSSIGSAIL